MIRECNCTCADVCPQGHIGTSPKCRFIVPDDTATIPTALYEQMAGLCRRMGAFPPEGLVKEAIERDYASAREIAKELPVEVDADLIEARECVASLYDDAHGALIAANIRKGRRDKGMDLTIALAALDRGRQLERGK